jgi:hypothetical protein
MRSLLRSQARSGRDDKGRWPPSVRDDKADARAKRLLLTVLAAYVAVQLLVPLRHLLYPGDVAWTEEGHRFSWRMKLREKEQTVELLLTAPSTGLNRTLDPRQFVTGWQYEGMEGRPDMLLQLAHHVAGRARQQGHPDVEVRVRALTSLNGRPAQEQIDPTVDLAAQPRSIWPAGWIVPLQ